MLIGNIPERRALFDYLPDDQLIFIEDEERLESDKWFHLLFNFSEGIRAKVPR